MTWTPNSSSPTEWQSRSRTSLPTPDPISNYLKKNNSGSRCGHLLILRNRDKSSLKDERAFTGISGIWAHDALVIVVRETTNILISYDRKLKPKVLMQPAACELITAFKCSWYSEASWLCLLIKCGWDYYESSWFTQNSLMAVSLKEAKWTAMGSFCSAKVTSIVLWKQELQAALRAQQYRPRLLGPMQTDDDSVSTGLQATFKYQ